MELSITHATDAEFPTVVFGFFSPEFSQCVYLRVDGDPVKVVQMANQIHEGFVNAAAAAVKLHRERDADTIPEGAHNED